MSRNQRCKGSPPFARSLARISRANEPARDLEESARRVLSCEKSRGERGNVACGGAFVRRRRGRPGGGGREGGRGHLSRGAKRRDRVTVIIYGTPCNHGSCICIPAAPGHKRGATVHAYILAGELNGRLPRRDKTSRYGTPGPLSPTLIPGLPVSLVSLSPVPR